MGSGSGSTTGSDSGSCSTTGSSSIIGSGSTIGSGSGSTMGSGSGSTIGSGSGSGSGFGASPSVIISGSVTAGRSGAFTTGSITHSGISSSTTLITGCSSPAPKSTNGMLAGSLGSFVSTVGSATGFISSKSTPSFSTTVSNCENGLLTSSFMRASGVKVILLWPSIRTRSPVLTFTLSRSSTSMILNVPKPFILTTLSFSRLVWMISNIALAKIAASRLFRPLRSTSTCARS